MAVYDTLENKRTYMTRETLRSLVDTVNFSRHRLVISDNGSCEETHALYKDFPFKVLYNGHNLGTARAINKVWRLRQPGEHAVKMDNDVVILQRHWADWIVDAFSRDRKLGILGLKRNDLAESPFSENLTFRSEVRMLPHAKGQRWITVEDVRGVMGTVQAYSSALLDKIGYLVQPTTYGFDDSLASVRAKAAGFGRAFLTGFEIQHIDPGGDNYCRWKIEQANKGWPEYQVWANAYTLGLRDVYEEGD